MNWMKMLYAIKHCFSKIWHQAATLGLEPIFRTSPRHFTTRAFGSHSAQPQEMGDSMLANLLIDYFLQ